MVLLYGIAVKTPFWKLRVYKLIMLSDEKACCSYIVLRALQKKSSQVLQTPIHSFSSPSFYLRLQQLQKRRVSVDRSCQAAMLEFWDSCTEINLYLSVHFNGLSLSEDFHYTSAPNNGFYQWWSSKDPSSLQWGMLGKGLSSSAQTMQVSCRSETELRYL